jgi:hypothetical protein
MAGPGVGGQQCIAAHAVGSNSQRPAQADGDASWHLRRVLQCNNLNFRYLINFLYCSGERSNHLAQHVGLKAARDAGRESLAHHRVGAADWQKAWLRDGCHRGADQLRFCREAVALLCCKWIEQGARALLMTTNGRLQFETEDAQESCKQPEPSSQVQLPHVSSTWANAVLLAAPPRLYDVEAKLRCCCAGGGTAWSAALQKLHANRDRCCPSTSAAKEVRIYTLLTTSSCAPAANGIPRPGRLVQGAGGGAGRQRPAARLALHCICPRAALPCRGSPTLQSCQHRVWSEAPGTRHCIYQQGRRCAASEHRKPLNLKRGCTHPICRIMDLRRHLLVIAAMRQGIFSVLKDCAPSELVSVCHSAAMCLLGLLLPPPPLVEPLQTRLVAECEGASRCMAALWSGVGSASDSMKAEELPVVIDAAT